jgi:hypothetical protein
MKHGSFQSRLAGTEIIFPLAFFVFLAIVNAVRRDSSALVVEIVLETDR